MGLDISYGKNIVAQPNAERDEEGDLIDWENLVELYVNPDYKQRAIGIIEGCAYACTDTGGFRAGSYGGYNAWREELAKLAGYKAIDVGYGSSGKKHAHSVWANPIDGPFMELINFSDCEGVIGHVVSAKLAKDFAEFQDKADSNISSLFTDTYNNFRLAFEFASENGYVDFH